MDAATDDAVGIDFELGKALVTAILSIILYGRHAFPEDCFRKASLRDLDHEQATHEHLLRSGRPLSFKDDPLHILSPDRQTMVYMRECSNPRLHSFLIVLNQIFAALVDRLVGKIYICFTDSKEWSKNSLLECYTLKFSYTELGDFHIYIDWAGKDDTPLKERISKDVFKSLKQVVIGCPQLPDVFYTHLFVSSVDNKTKLEAAWAGDGHGVREALLNFKRRDGSSSGRVGRFSCASPSQDAAQEVHDVNEPFPPGLSPRATTPELPELCHDDLADVQSANHLPSSASSTLDSSTSEPHLAASPARPASESSVIEKPRRPRKIFTSHPHRKGPAEAPSQPEARSYPDNRCGGIYSEEDHGHDTDEPAQNRPSSGSTLVEHPLRRSSTKRSASQGLAMPPTRNSDGEVPVASKHPRLAMIEEIPEDLPPTQRLKTPSQTWKTQRSTFANPDCFTSDSEGSPSEDKATATLRNTWQGPQDVRQMASNSRSPQKANTARLYDSHAGPLTRKNDAMA